MSYILLMTTAGSILFIGYLLCEKLAGEHTSQTHKYRAMIFVMFTYLVPWVWLKDFYKSISRLFLRKQAMAVNGRLILDEAAIRRGGQVALTPNYSLILWVVGIWIAVAVALMLIRCLFYFFHRRRLLKLSADCEEELSVELLERLKGELHLKRSPRIVRLRGRGGSLTIGAVKPVVFLQKDIREEELELVLRHEFIHIARGDLFISLVMGLVCCIHWFNPLAYLFSIWLRRVSEKACDERVVRDKTAEERELYAKLIVRSIRAPKRKVLFGSFLASDEKYAEERIRVIMNKREMKRWEKIAVAGVFAVMVFADSLTALAYPRVMNVEVETEKVVEESRQGNALLYYDSGNSTLSDTFYPVVYDEELITAEGEIREPQAQTRWLCIHHWQKGEYQTHMRDDKGGCTIKFYECTYCLNCDTIKVGDLICSAYYAKCPHDDLP